jgi:diadenylate cyclase
MMPILIDIGFLHIRILDVLDILIVGYLIFQIYKLLKGTMAFNIFIGLMALYSVSWLVRILQMDLLKTILSEFVNVGVIALLIVFQPEIRRFLLFVGSSALKGRARFWGNLFTTSRAARLSNKESQECVVSLEKALLKMGRNKTGALIVFTNNSDALPYSSSRVSLNADISSSLIESIFSKESPLHDGAVVIQGDKIKAAGCVLPISSSRDLPNDVGLRHRAAVGVTENSDMTAFVASEENGLISYAEGGVLHRNIDKERLHELLLKWF